MFGHVGDSLGRPGDTLLYQGHSPFNLYYRPLQPADYDALKAVHRDLFPIDYEEVFFRKAISSEDRVFSWAAVHSEFGRDHMVGFVTARLVYLYECDPLDRQVMGLSSKALDSHCTVYVLTLGVVASCRKCGIARHLLRLVHQHAARMRCRLIFLHVISYNDAAMRLYGTSGYQPMARLPNFYHLTTGRQPHPEQAWYDAFLYVTFLPTNGPEPSPAMQWAGGMLGAAVAPFRSMLGTFNGCMPGWLCSRQTYSTFLPFASSLPPRSPSKSSLADTATSAWQQQQQQQAPTTLPPTNYAQQPTQGPSAAGSFAGSLAEPPFLQQQQQQQPCAEGRQQQWDGPGRPQQQLGRSSSSGLGGSTATIPYGMEPCGAAAGSSASATSGHANTGPAASCRRMGSPREGQQEQQQQQQQQHSCYQDAQLSGGPLLRPPSPLVLPNHSPSLTSLMQRHPHGAGGGGGNGPNTPHAASQGLGAAGHQHHHGHHHHGHHNHNHGHNHHGSGPYHSGSGSSGSVGNHSHGHAHAHGQSQAHGYSRHGEFTRGGIAVQRAPHGLAGGGLQHYSQQQSQLQQQQQGGGSLLTSLFRPPVAQPHPHSR